MKGDKEKATAIVAAIALTLRRRKGSKSQNVADQIAVKRADRVRMVSMPSEPRVGSVNTK